MLTVAAYAALSPVGEEVCLLLQPMPPVPRGGGSMLTVAAYAALSPLVGEEVCLLLQPMLPCPLWWGRKYAYFCSLCCPVPRR